VNHRLLLCGAALCLFVPPVAAAAATGAVVINEVAWMGSLNNTSHEWIELYNTTGAPVDIAEWSIHGADTNQCLNLSDADLITTTVIPARGYLLYANGIDEVENVNGVSLVDIDDATMSLNNTSPGTLELHDTPGCGGTPIDVVNLDGGDWPAGINPSDDLANWGAMERISPFESGIDTNWCTNDGITRNGIDAGNNPINGTPKARNSCTQTSILTVNRTGSGNGEVESALGAIDCGATCSAAFISGTPLTLTAASGPDSTFAGWSGCDAASGDVCELSLDANRTVEASFELAGGDGDVNGDGWANVIDARICLRFALGRNQLGPDAQTVCDVNGDGAVTRADAEEVARHDIGQPSALARGAMSMGLLAALGGAWWLRRRRLGGWRARGVSAPETPARSTSRPARRACPCAWPARPRRKSKRVRLRRW